jgi:hypothetical protein
MENRYKVRGKFPGLSLLASSVRTEEDFLAHHIEKNRANRHTLILNTNEYEMKPPEKYLDKWCKIAVGKEYTQSFAISEDEVPTYEANGFTIHSIPKDDLDTFEDDKTAFIRDRLGIALRASGRFLDEDKVRQAILPCVTNVMAATTLKLGFGDNSSLFDYFEVGNITPTLISQPLFLHMDLALSGDNCGIVIVALASADIKEKYFMTHPSNQLAHTDDAIAFIRCFGARYVLPLKESKFR